MKILDNNLAYIVAQLNSDKFQHSATLSEKLNIPLAEISQAIKKLYDYGVVITSSNKQGYRLAEPLVLLNEERIKKLVKNKISIKVLETISSTMDYFTTDIAEKQIQACFAEVQTAGRGRFNRYWHALFGQNINLSLQYRFTQDASQLTGLSLVVGLSVCHTLKKYNLNKPLQIKWPNDLIYDNKKLGGILVESRAVNNRLCSVIIGIGINVNLLNDQQITQPWTSLRKVTGKIIDRNRLGAQLLDDLPKHINTFLDIGLDYFMQRWKSVDYLYGQYITISDSNNKISGVVQGIDQQGYLILKQKNGNIILCSSGDITIVKPPIQ